MITAVRALYLPRQSGNAQLERSLAALAAAAWQDVTVAARAARLLTDHLARQSCCVVAM
jgi:hypothetical protein